MIQLTINLFLKYNMCKKKEFHDLYAFLNEKM